MMDVSIPHLAWWGKVTSYSVTLGATWWYFRRHAVSPSKQTRKDLCQHIRVQGMQGSGKSTLVLNLIKAQLRAGWSVFVIDPHGPLAQAVRKLAPHALYHHPKSNPLGMNVLSLKHGTEEEMELTVDNVTSLVRHLTSQWGDVQDAKLHRALWLALERPNPTLDDVKDCLEDHDDRSTQGIIARLDKLTESPTLKKMMSKPAIDFRGIMDSGGVYILDMSGLGKGTANIVYQLHMLRIQQCAIGRPERAKGVFLACDEAQRMARSADELQNMLMELRKNAICVCLAHHVNHQLEAVSKVYGLVGTQYLFRLTEEDARRAKGIVRPLEWETLETLPNYTCIRRRQVWGRPEKAHIYRTPPPPKGEVVDDTPPTTRRRSARISRTTKGRDHESVAQEIFPQLQADRTKDERSRDGRSNFASPHDVRGKMGVRVFSVRSRKESRSEHP